MIRIKIKKSHLNKKIRILKELECYNLNKFKVNFKLILTILIKTCYNKDTGFYYMIWLNKNSLKITFLFPSPQILSIFLSWIFTSKLLPGFVTYGATIKKIDFMGLFIQYFPIFGWKNGLHTFNNMKTTSKILNFIGY